MIYTLRPYQQRASDAGVQYFLDEDRRHNALIVASTGCGKSLIIADIAARLNEKVLVFCPSKEILEQNYRKMTTYGIPCSMYSASVNKKEISQITFVTIGSVKNEADLFKEFRYIMIDEAHLVNPKRGMYKQFLSVMKRKVLGLTATPYRLETDKKMDWESKKFESATSKLVMLTAYKRPVFREIICNIEASELMEQGYLSKMRYFHLPPPDWQEGKLFKNTTGSDYSDLSVRRMFKTTNFKAYLLSIIRRLMIPKDGKERNGILVFTRFVEDAQDIARQIDGAAYISGAMSKTERERVLKDFEEGRVKVLANAGVLIVGYDRPDLDTVLLATPTLSLARYYQEIGRALRISPEKEEGWIVDLCGNLKRFGVVSDLNMRKCENGWEVFSKDRQLTSVEL